MLNLKKGNRVKLMTALLLLIIQYSSTCLSSEIVFQRVPDEGIQPVLVTDQEGDVHLLYFKEQDETTSQGHFYYRRFIERDDSWTEAIQVSTNPYFRPHLIARASMAVDYNRQIHVTWHQDRPVEQFPTPNGSDYLPDYFYTRSLEKNSAFEPERSFIREFITGAETGAVLAVHDDMVTLIWHGSEPDREEIESEGSVYRIVSLDNGITFGREQLIGDQSLGACGCCGLSAAYDRLGNLQVAYRTAVDNEGRHMQLLEVNSGKASMTTLIHSWQLEACPVSTNNLTKDKAGNNHLVFETKGLIYQADLGTDNPNPRQIQNPLSKQLQKHPAIAINDKGDKLIVWNEGNGVNGGGSLRWQVFNPADEPVSRDDKEEREVAEHSAAAVTTLRDGTFLVLY